MPFCENLCLQLLGEGNGVFEVDLLRFFNERADDECLAAAAEFFFDKAVHGGETR